MSWNCAYSSVCRNPWGKTKKGIWEGAWSDGSKEWTTEAQQELGHQFGSDSVFWISYEDLLRKYQHFDRTRLFRNPDWRCCQRWIGVEVPWKPQYNEKFHIKLTRESPLVLVLSQLDNRYFKGLTGQYSFRLQFRLHDKDRPVPEDYIVRSHGNYLMDRSVSVELPSMLPGNYSVFISVIGERDTKVPSIEEVVKRECKERAENEKLAQVGYAYDLAHSKAAAHLEAVKKLRKKSDQKKASSARLKERHRLWEKRHLNREVTKRQGQKNNQKLLLRQAIREEKKRIQEGLKPQDSQTEEAPPKNDKGEVKEEKETKSENKADDKSAQESPKAVDEKTDAAAAELTPEKSEDKSKDKQFKDEQPKDEQLKEEKPKDDQPKDEKDDAKSDEPSDSKAENNDEAAKTEDNINTDSASKDDEAQGDRDAEGDETPEGTPIPTPDETLAESPSSSPSIEKAEDQASVKLEDKVNLNNKKEDATPPEEKKDDAAAKNSDAKTSDTDEEGKPEDKSASKSKEPTGKSDTPDDNKDKDGADDKERNSGKQPDEAPEDKPKNKDKPDTKSDGKGKASDKEKDKPTHDKNKADDKPKADGKPKDDKPKDDKPKAEEKPASTKSEGQNKDKAATPPPPPPKTGAPLLVALRSAPASDGESSASPIEDWEALYSSDDMTRKPRLNPPPPFGTIVVSKYRDESDDEKGPDPWNAICVIGLRVYSKDEDLELRIVMEGGEFEEGGMGEKGGVDIDNAQANAGGARSRKKEDEDEGAYEGDSEIEKKKKAKREKKKDGEKIDSDTEKGDDGTVQRSRNPALLPETIPYPNAPCSRRPPQLSN